MIPHQPLVTPELLVAAKNILFVGHFTPQHLVYLNQQLRAFAVVYPHISLSLFTSYAAPARWLPWQTAGRDVLKDWCVGLPVIKKLYRSDDLKQLKMDAQQQPFEVVISLADENQPYFARLARRLAGKGLVIATQNLTRWYDIRCRFSFKRCDHLLQLTPENQPLSEYYLAVFQQLFGPQLVGVRDLPRVQLPKQWITYAKLLFLKWGIDKKNKQFSKVVFVSPYAEVDRSGASLSLPEVLEFITQLSRRDEYGDVSFIINVPEHKLKKARAFFTKQSVNNAHLFCANTNFFQLPALISLCDWVVATPSLSLHLAYALAVPTVKEVSSGDIQI